MSWRFVFVCADRVWESQSGSSERETETETKTDSGGENERHRESLTSNTITRNISLCLTD